MTPSAVFFVRERIEANSEDQCSYTRSLWCCWTFRFGPETEEGDAL